MQRSTFITFCFAVIFSAAGCQKPEMYHEAVDILDKTIGNRKENERQTEAMLDSLKLEMAKASDPVAKYEVGRKLYLGYSRYDVDSALAYAHKNIELAISSANNDLLFEARMDLADRYKISGMFDAVFKVLDDIDTSTLSNIQLFKYYNFLSSVYNGMSRTERDPVRKEALHAKTLDNIRMIPRATDIVPVDSITLLMNSGDTRLAREMVLDLYSSGRIEDEAGFHFWLAKIYSSEGDRNNALSQYALSSNSDLLPPVTVSRSLTRTARMLYEDGNTLHAYKYLLTSYEYADRADARVAMEEIRNYFPKIIRSYESLNRKNLTIITTALVILSAFVVFLVLAVLIIGRDRRRIRKMQDKLERHIVQLKESNELKDTYLGRYMSMFSEHIDSLERYRSSLRNVAKSLDIQQIQTALRDDTQIEAERQALFDKFDETFIVKGSGAIVGNGGDVKFQVIDSFADGNINIIVSWPDYSSTRYIAELQKKKNL